MPYKTIIYIFCMLFMTSQLWAVDNTYSFGVVPQFNPRVTKQTWQPILDEINQHIDGKLMLKVSSRIPEFEKDFEQGRYDFAYMNPYHAVVAKKKQNYQPVLHDRARRLFGIIVVHKDSPLKDVKELDGKKIAMPAPNALGAALIPRAEFANKFKIAPKISYVRSHDSVYLNTAIGTVDAGGGVMGTLNRQPREVQDQLRILYKTGNVAKHPITVHPRVPAKLVKSVTDAFIALGKTEQGKALLKPVPIHEIGETSFKDYEELIDMDLEKFYIAK